MADVDQQDRAIEPEFNPNQLAYSLDKYRLDKDGLLNGTDLINEIVNDLNALLPHHLQSGEQKAPLCIQVSGAKPEEKPHLEEFIANECRKIEPRLKDIQIQCEDFQGDMEVEGGFGEALAALGFQPNTSDGQYALTKNTNLSLRLVHVPLTLRIKKEEDEPILEEEAQQIADFIVYDIFKAVGKWNPGDALTVQLTSCETKLMHQEIVEQIIQQVFQVALRELKEEYAEESPPIIPNVKLQLRFRDTFADHPIEADGIELKESNPNLIGLEKPAEDKSTDEE